MSEQPPQQSNQSLNISDSVLETVQIGGIAGHDLNLTQIQGGVGAINVYGSVQVGQASLSSAKPISQQEYQWRKVLLGKVKQFWVDGVLAKSLHSQTLIELGLEERSEYIQNPLAEVEEFPSDARVVFPPGSSATDIFEGIGAGRTLLILGEPGAGKTVTLLKLAESLIKRAENDLSQPLPVVVNLSSWAKQRKSLAKWLAQELFETYQVSLSLGKAWIEQEQFILLLDGLDEVAAQHRDACVQVLNRFIQAHGCTEMVVCSRIRDYEALSERLKLRSVIYVQPLTPQQITQFFEHAGEPLRALKKVLQQNAELRALASSPLILNIMSLAYQGWSVDNIIQGGTIQEYRQQLFDTYITRMFEGARKAAYTGKITESAQKYPRKKAQHWLTWISQRMVQNSQTVFLIERIQPSWLQTKLQRIWYRLEIALIIGSTIGLIMGFGVGLTAWLLSGPGSASNLGLSFGLAIGFICGLISGSLGNIRTVETLKWSWHEAKRSFLYGVSYGLVGMLIFGVMYRLSSELTGIELVEQLSEKNYWLRLVTAMLGVSLLVGLMSGLMGGYRGPEIQKKGKPNQGIWQSARNALMITLSLFLFCLIIGLFQSLFTGRTTGLIRSSLVGLTSGIFGGLIGGGAACLRHFALRLMLYRMGYIPWNYTRFLDHAADRLFLQKVGGGYIFVHRMLLEHFAQMELEQEKS